tara:strand:+ start:10 stop:384 length:375 start_codon:yes stop_codon:yes gene_type:complete
MEEKKYSQEHEWISLKDNVATVGITNHAQESLGDIVFVELPKIGLNVDAGKEISVIESVKAASDIFCPVDGEILEVNNDLNDDPSIINKDAENQGWIFKIKVTKPDQLNHLMTLSGYEEFLKKA